MRSCWDWYGKYMKIHGFKMLQSSTLFDSSFLDASLAMRFLQSWHSSKTSQSVATSRNCSELRNLLPHLFQVYRRLPAQLQLPTPLLHLEIRPPTSLANDIQRPIVTRDVPSYRWPRDMHHICFTGLIQDLSIHSTMLWSSWGWNSAILDWRLKTWNTLLKTNLEPEDPHQEQKEHLPRFHKALMLGLEVFALGGVYLQQDPLAIQKQNGLLAPRSMLCNLHHLSLQ